MKDSKKMSNCKFCEGKVIKAHEYGEGIKTMKTMFNSLLGLDNDYDESYRAEDGVMLNSGNVLSFDNSSGEYAEMFIEINYCPFCGKKLERE